MSEAMNKIKWTTFVKQAKGQDVTEIHVTREDRPSAVVLKYTGKHRRSTKILAGEWILGRGEDEAALAKAIKDFLERARKEFFVKREGSLGGEGFASKQDEEGAKAKTIVNEAEKK